MSANSDSLETCITDFSNLAAQKWKIVNDGVMGGISESSFQINEDGHAVFLGTISLENNGGFASVRNHEPLNLEGYKSLRLQIKGDGKRYCFRLWTAEDDNIHRFSYDIRFDTDSDKWIDVILPFSEFHPFIRGMPVMDVPPLDLSNINRYGFLISDKQQGEFRLEIAGIWGISSHESR